MVIILNACRGSVVKTNHLDIDICRSKQHYIGNISSFLSIDTLIRDISILLANWLIIANFHIMNENYRENSKSAPFSNCSFPPPNFYRITGEEKLAEILNERWGEINRCLENEAHLAGIILMGGIIEAVLLAIVKRFPQKARECESAPLDRDGKIKKFNDWTLNDLINVAHDCGWIENDAAEFSHLLRKYRNLVHPWEQLELKKELPTKDSCGECWKVVRTALYDLEKVE